MKLGFGNTESKRIAALEAKDERAERLLMAEMRVIYRADLKREEIGRTPELAKPCTNCGLRPWDHDASGNPGWVGDTCQGDGLRPAQFLTALWHVSLRKHGHAKLCRLMLRILAEGKC